MKSMTILVLFVLTSGTLSAQPPDQSARCKEEMKKLSYLVGDWKGEAAYHGQKISQAEHIEWKLNGLVLSIDGKGTLLDASGKEQVVFQAFAVVHFDPVDGQFKLKSFVKEGYSTNAYFTVIADNKFEWGFDIPAGGKFRYTITLDPQKKTWYELGEYSRDGSSWLKSIELNLVKL